MNCCTIIDCLQIGAMPSNFTFFTEAKRLGLFRRIMQIAGHSMVRWYDDRETEKVRLFTECENGNWKLDTQSIIG